MPSELEISCDIKALELAALNAFSEMLNVNPFSKNPAKLSFASTKSSDDGSSLEKLTSDLSDLMNPLKSFEDILKNLPPLNSNTSSISRWIKNRGFDDFAEQSSFNSNMGISGKYISQFLDEMLDDDLLNYPKEWRGSAKSFITDIAKFNEQEKIINLQSFVFKTKSGANQKPNPGAFV
jgi:hypothetical protein